MVFENLKKVKERIRHAAERVGRNDRDIILVCVTKTANMKQIEEALVAGATDIGENYVNDAVEKFRTIGYRAKWHMIGHLQTNKVKEAVRIFDLIHSVDSFRLAEEISRRAAAMKITKKILVEVKTSQEENKFGLLPEQVVSLMERISELPNVRVLGLMTMAPFSEDPENSRPYFARLRKLSMLISNKRLSNIKMEYLSMGMTQDFEVAIEEGANILRIGRAIFEV